MLKIYNTMSRSLEEFKPLETGKVKFYQCGPTVYSHQHIGNLVSAIRGDFIRRTIIYLGYDLKYVKNVTDVGHLVSDEDEGEDKMTKGAKATGLSPEEIASKYSAIYHSDLQKLNVLEPDVETIATQYVFKMAEMVQELLDKGFAYATDKAIYFDVDKFPKYTALSGQKLEENVSGAGHGDTGDSDKRKPYDFAIWFFKVGQHVNTLQVWDVEFVGIDQPTVEGFPGWHIECSAMARDTLGNRLDLHMGGIEHIPTHHSNEIAQSESANGEKYVNYWLHHEWLTVNGDKMAKSIGNIYTLDQIEEKGFDPIAFRYFMAQAHYRSKQNFTWEALQGAETALDRIQSRIRELNDSGIGEIDGQWKQRFVQVLEDDFNIPQGLAILWDMLKSDLEESSKLATALDFDRVLGLNLAVSEAKLSVPEGAQQLIDARDQARTDKDWDLSDQLRDQLSQEFGVVVEDTPDGQQVKFVR